jgi:hypothetical protein
MPRKKTKATNKTTPSAPVPSGTGPVVKILIGVVVAVFGLGLIYSLVSFFLPSLLFLPFSFFGRWGVSEYPSALGLPALKAPADYRISQTDDYPVSMEVTLPWFNLGSRGNFNVVSSGLPVSLAAPGDPDWKTEWRVYQDTVYQADLDGALHHEEQQGSKYFLVDIPGKGIKAKSSGQNVLTFSLAGVPEGGTFPIKIEASHGSSQMESATQETKLIDRDPESGVNLNWRGSVDYNDADTYQDKSFSATGKLIKDNGQAGAVISIGSGEMPQEYKDAIQKIRELSKGAPGGLANLYDANGHINNDSGIASMDTPAEKPLRIFLNSEQ